VGIGEGERAVNLLRSGAGVMWGEERRRHVEGAVMGREAKAGSPVLFPGKPGRRRGGTGFQKTAEEGGTL